MNGIILEVKDYPKKTESSSQAPAVESSLLQKMKRAYTDFFQTEYESKLHKDQNGRAVYPRLLIAVEGEEEAEEIIFDYEFFEQLLALYVVKGWSSVLAIEKRVEKIIEEIEEADPRAVSGGTPDIKWERDVFPKETGSWHLAQTFFAFTRKIIALLIRETLSNIEKAAAAQIIFKLSLTNIEAAKVFAKYKIQNEDPPDIKKSGGSKQRPDPSPASFSIGEPRLAKELFELLTAIVDEKHNFDQYAIKSKTFGGEKTEHLAKSRQTNVPFDISRQRELAEDAEQKEIKYTSLKDASEHLLNSLNQLIEKQHALGLLISGSLKKGFEQPEMERLFGLTIVNLRKDLESLGAKIDPAVAQVEKLLPFKQTEDTRLDILNFGIGEQGVENFVLEAALAKYQDSEFFPLLAEENLNRLFDKETFENDSFESVVGFHYLSALIKKLGEIEKAEKQWENFWTEIGKFSSALSLAVLITPATTPIAPLLRGGAAIADLALLAHTVSSVINSLRRNDDLMKTTLVNQGDLTTESLARLGEVISLRREFYENLTEQLAIELLAVSGGNVPVFKELLLARSYYFDIETLIEIEDETEAGN